MKKQAFQLLAVLGCLILPSVAQENPANAPSKPATTPAAPGAAPAATNSAPSVDREAVLRSFMQQNKAAGASAGANATPPPIPGATASPSGTRRTPTTIAPPGSGAASPSATTPPAPPNITTSSSGATIRTPATTSPTQATISTPTPSVRPANVAGATEPSKKEPTPEEQLKNFDPDNPPVGENDPETFMAEFDFKNMPLDQFLDVIYASYTKRTVLRSAQLPAVQITLKAQSELNREEIIQALDSVLALNGITMIPTGDKFVTAVPVAQALQEGAAFKDRETSELNEASQWVTQIVSLQHVHPVDAQALISPFSKNANGIVVLESNKMLILRDYAINVKRMLEVIKKIDVAAPPSEIQPEVIPIKYALASDISQVISSLTTGGGSGGAPVGAAGAASSSRTTRNRSSRTGSGLGAGSTGGLNQFGQPNSALGNTGVGAAGANRAGAAGGSFQQRLQQIVSRASSAGELEILGDVKILADERTNSLLVFANKEDMRMITNIIGKLDIVLQQVLIEAIIMEVSTDNGRSFGVSYRQEPKRSGKFTGVGAVNNGQGFLSTFPNITGSGTNAAAAVPGGFSYFGQMAGNFDMALQAIADDSTINVLQRPRIQTSHAVPASFFVGETVPTITGSAYGDFGSLYGGSRNSYTQLRVGVQLDVTPLINPDGLVVMDIEQKIDQLGPNVKIDNNDVPTTTSREAAATIAVKDRDTIILGGFIKSDRQGSKSGVPFLKDVPVLGAMFRSSSSRKRQTEMIVLMRPTVLPTPEAASLAAKADRSQTPEIRRAESEYLDDINARNRKADAAESKRRKK